jgi:hypothetical protein
MNLSTASGRLNVNVLASVSAFEAEIAQERAKDTIAARRARGDDVGSAPYGFRLRAGRLEPDPDRPMDVVLDAYREAGTYAGAAKLLNRRKATAPRGARWSGPAVRRIINRAMPETRTTTGRPGRKPRADFLLSGLLVCPCGTTMTGRVHRQRRTYGVRDYRYVSYVCWRGRYDAAHQRPYMVNEAGVLPWVRDEVARLRVPERVEMAEDAATRDELEGKRARIVETFIEGLIDKAERDRRLSAIADELDRLEAVAGVVEVPAIDWSWDPPTLNRVLRGVFRSIRLGTDLRPVDAEWRVPEFRGP